MFQAVHQGYQERIMDMQELAVEQGYWCGYYVNANKKTLQPEAIITDMRTQRTGSASQPKKKAKKVNMEDEIATFKERAKKLKEQKGR